MKKIYLWMVFAVAITWLSLRWLWVIFWTNILDDLLWNEYSHNTDSIAIAVISDDEHIHSDDHPHETWVLVVAPKSIEQDDLSEKTYIGSVYSPYYGQVFPFREWMIEKLTVDVEHLINARLLATASKKRLGVKGGLIGFFRRFICRGRIAQG